jgi:hypothetical protein
MTGYSIAPRYIGESTQYGAKNGVVTLVWKDQQ